MAQHDMFLIFIVYVQFIIRQDSLSSLSSLVNFSVEYSELYIQPYFDVVEFKYVLFFCNVIPSYDM